MRLNRSVRGCRRTQTFTGCRKASCGFEQINGVLHSQLYLAEIFYGYRKNRPFIKAIYFSDAGLMIVLTTGGNFRNKAQLASLLTAVRDYFLAIVFLICVPVFDCAAQDKNRVRISRIQAKIFYNNTGAFSQDAIGGSVDLWNSPFDPNFTAKSAMSRISGHLGDARRGGNCRVGRANQAEMISESKLHIPLR